jgi:hypothetical protein
LWLMLGDPCKFDALREGLVGKKREGGRGLGRATFVRDLNYHQLA